MFAKRGLQASPISNKPFLSCSEARGGGPEALQNQLKEKLSIGKEPVGENIPKERQGAKSLAAEPEITEEQQDLTNGLLQSSGVISFLTVLPPAHNDSQINLNSISQSFILKSAWLSHNKQLGFYDSVLQLHSIYTLVVFCSETFMHFCMKI